MCDDLLWQSLFESASASALLNDDDDNNSLSGQNRIRSDNNTHAAKNPEKKRRKKNKAVNVTTNGDKYNLDSYRDQFQQYLAQRLNVQQLSLLRKLRVRPSSSTTRSTTSDSNSSSDVNYIVDQYLPFWIRQKSNHICSPIQRTNKSSSRRNLSPSTFETHSFDNDDDNEDLGSSMTFYRYVMTNDDTSNKSNNSINKSNRKNNKTRASYHLQAFLDIINIRSICKVVALNCRLSRVITTTRTRTKTKTLESGNDDSNNQKHFKHLSWESLHDLLPLSGTALPQALNILLEESNVSSKIFNVSSASANTTIQLNMNMERFEQSRLDLCEKYQRLMTRYVSLKKQQKQQHSQRHQLDEIELLEDAILCVIACDELYMNLYYAQITDTLPISPRMIQPSSSLHRTEAKKKQTDNDYAFIPHPTLYFSMCALATGSMEFNYDQNLHGTVGNRYEQGSPDQSNHHREHSDENTVSEHALEILYRLRQDETNQLLQRTGWARHPMVRDQTWNALQRSSIGNTNILSGQTQSTKSSNKKKKKKRKRKQIDNDRRDETSFYQHHETPAAMTLQSWRNSTRDFLCHLYCYATIPSKVLKSVTALLVSFNIHTVVEIGAGTGYLSSIMKTTFEDHVKARARARAPPSVDGDVVSIQKVESIQWHAFDSHPTVNGRNEDLNSSPTMNEYHGATPPFMAVDQWSSDINHGSPFPIAEDDDKKDCDKDNDDSSSRISTNNHNGKNNNIHQQQSALLLCYPPPKSEMAYDTLRMFMKGGGSCSMVIHVGEFKGLTGNERFETLLRRNFECIFRRPCLSWGSDCSHVTIWSLRRSGDHPAKPLTSSSGMSNQQRLLLPCVECQQRESTKRCRLLRHLTYCSQRCFDRHSDQRRLELQANMVHGIDDEDSINANDTNSTKHRLSFSNPSHFLSI